MSLKDKLMAKKAELADLKEGIDAGEDEAIASAKSLMDEIDGIEAAISVAEKSNSILASIKADETTVAKKNDSIAAVAASMVKAAGFKAGDRINIQTPEAKANTDVVSAHTHTEDSPRFVEQPHRDLVFADLFSAETFSGNTNQMEIAVEEPIEGDFAVVAEKGEKPQITWDYTTKTVGIEKIAGFLKMSDEFLEDEARFVTFVNGRLRYRLGVKEEDYLVGKLLGTSGLQTLTYDPTEDRGIAEAILKAQTLIGINTDYKPDAVVLNPSDFEALRLVTDSNGQYYGGGFFTGEYGNGAINQAGSIWGLKIYVSSAIDAGTVIVGDFKGAASVIRKGGVRMDVTNSNEDDFTHNLVACRLEERVGIAVYVPAAFCVITDGSADTDTDTDTDTE